MYSLHSKPAWPFLLAFVVFCLTQQSCAPIFSEFQTARTVGKDKLEIVPFYSHLGEIDNGNTYSLQSHGGLQFAYGFCSNFDLRARFDVIGADGWGEGRSAFSIGGKYSIIEDRLSVFLPVGRALGENTSDSWQIQPTAFLTVPVLENRLDATIGPKYVFTFGQNTRNYAGANLGLSFSTDINKWAIRPEYGILFNPDQSGLITQFGIGFSATIGTKSGN
ncbi:MAG: hypothetical protein R3B47_19575 [Bacteroidia bacterium]